MSDDLDRERAEMAQMQRALTAPRRRRLWILLGVVGALTLVAIATGLYVLSLFASGPSMSGTPGCFKRRETLPDGGVTWVDTCPPPPGVTTSTP